MNIHSYLESWDGCPHRSCDSATPVRWCSLGSAFPIAWQSKPLCSWCIRILNIVKEYWILAFLPERSGPVCMDLELASNVLGDDQDLGLAWKTQKMFLEQKGCSRNTNVVLETKKQILVWEHNGRSRKTNTIIRIWGCFRTQEKKYQN